MLSRRKINGFNPPLNCPRDFAEQIRRIIFKHNECIDECSAYQQALREMQKRYRVLSKEYEELKDVSEKLAQKYEKLVNDNPVVSDDDDNSPLTKQDVNTVINSISSNASPDSNKHT